MAEVYDRERLVYAGLKKTSDALFAEQNRINVNAEKQRSLATEAAMEIGRQVQRLKDAGQVGAAVDDFNGDAEVRKLLKYVASLQNTADTLGRDFGKLGADSKSHEKDLGSLVARLDKEIKDRNKKKDRRFFSVDSKSLPDLEKLLESADKAHQRLQDMILEVKGGFMISPNLFDRLIDAQVKLTKEDRTKRDSSAMGNQALNMRVLNRKSAEAASAYKSLVECCTKAAMHLRDQKLDEGRQQIVAAQVFLKTLSDINTLYSKTLEDNNEESMKQTKDGKIVLAKMLTIKKNTQDATRLVQAAGKKLQM